MLLLSLLTGLMLFSFLRIRNGLFPVPVSSSNTTTTEALRQSLKARWLAYYRDNRHWLNHLQVWVTYEGHRRPNSSFILATLSTLDSQFAQMLPLIVDLNRDPDRIIVSLGLDFDPEKELETFLQEKTDTKMLAPGADPVTESASRLAARVDESCEGAYKKPGDSSST